MFYCLLLEYDIGPDKCLSILKIMVEINSIKILYIMSVKIQQTFQWFPSIDKLTHGFVLFTSILFNKMMYGDKIMF